MTDDRDNVKEFPMEIQAAVNKMKVNMTALEEYQRVTARLQREKYNALLEQGFSEQQAVFLCQRVLPSE